MHVRTYVGWFLQLAEHTALLRPFKIKFFQQANYGLKIL